MISSSGYFIKGQGEHTARAHIILKFLFSISIFTSKGVCHEILSRLLSTQ